MIRDEEGQLTGYVFIDLKTRDYGGFVDQASQLLSRELKLPVGFTYQSSEAIASSAFDAVGRALDALGGEPARAALVFDCAGRKRAAGGGLNEEVAAIASSFGDAPPPFAGAYVHGEIGRVRGAKGDRNHAIVVVAFG